MGRVNRDALEQGLRTLEQDGLIASWQARPLNMYWIRTSSGEDLRPNVKETAMWVMGALHGNAAARAGTAVLREEPIDGQLIAAGLDTLQGFGVLVSWLLDEAGDYHLGFPDGGSSAIPANFVWPWVIGATSAWKLFDHGPVQSEDKQSTEGRLKTLNLFGVIESWVVENGQYAVTVTGAERPTVTGPRETLAWSDGAMIATLIQMMKGDTEDEEDRLGIEDTLTKLTDQGRIKAWWRDDDEDYVVQLDTGESSIVMPRPWALGWMERQRSPGSVESRRSVAGFS